VIRVEWPTHFSGHEGRRKAKADALTASAVLGINEDDV
jgi:hypothetical protein